ncbi:hypothetical protein R1flu_010890 [Riccia fluitans]|uniref:glutathione transferase n=1 Tax=Riccia fluitans TaxID=41844 RepID=A0ABD1Z695_9MARC
MCKRSGRLFGAPYSISTSRVAVVLNEKNIEYALRIVDTSNRGLRILKNEHKDSRYIALNPFGKTPLFQDHEVTMYESRAIIRHIAQKHDEHGPHLYGTSEKERAMVDQWLEVESQNFNPAIAPAVYQLVFAAWFGKIGDMRIVNPSIERLEKVLDVYEGQLMRTKFLAGDSVSIADLSHLPFTYYLVEHAGRDDIFFKRPHVQNWWTSIFNRPSWTSHLLKAYPKIYFNSHA